jgi:hypothetical protein
MTLLSRNQAYYSSLKPEECVDWSDWTNLMPIVLASFVTHEDPVIQQASGRVAKWAGGANAAGSNEEALKYMKAVYLFMGENIAYQTPPVGESEKQFHQHVKYGRDVLKNKAGTCIDLAILYGSMCEAVGLEAVLYSVPGHCFPAVKMPQNGRIVPLESTMIGRASFEDAVQTALEKQFKQFDAGTKPFTKVDIAQIQKQGALPMDLPSVGEDPLDKWGIKMPAVQLGENRPNPNPNPQQPNPTPNRPKADFNFVGTWATRFVIKGVQVAQLVKFTNDGHYESASKFSGPGGTTSQADSGTYSVTHNRMVLKSEVTGQTLVRPFQPKSADSVEVEVEEIGQTVTFSRVR